MNTDQKLDKILKLLEEIKEHLKPTEARKDFDKLYKEAKKLVLEKGQISASILQRHLKVGYSYTAHLLDKMEEEGIVGPADGAQPRKMLKK